MAVRANDPDQLAPDAPLFIPSPVAPRFCLFAHPPWSTRGEAEFRNERITADSQLASIINKSVPESSRCSLKRFESSYKKVISISNTRY